LHVIHTVAGIAEHAGGPSRTVTSLCSSIGHLGVAVDLVTGLDLFSGDQLIRPDPNNVNLHFVDAHRLGRFRYCPRFSHTLVNLLDKEMQSTLIHDHGIWGYTNMAAWRVAHSRSVPYVISPRGMLEPWALEFKARKKKLAWVLYQRRIIASAAAAVATSEQECENVKRLFPKLPVAVIPNGVCLPSNHESLPPKSRADKGGIVLFMSRIHPKKNLIGLLNAWAALPQQVAKDWRLVIAGPDEAGHAGEIMSQVQKLGLQDNVDLIGAVGEDAKALVFQSADLFVLPSFSENFGVVVAEALAYGIPVIATTGTPWHELPRLGCGWWVDPTPESLSNALLEAMSTSLEQRCNMGVIGRAYVQEEFSWDSIGGATIALYEWLLNQDTPRPSFVY